MHTYIHIHTYTYIHTHTYTYIQCTCALARTQRRAHYCVRAALQRPPLITAKTTRSSRTTGPCMPHLHWVGRGTAHAREDVPLRPALDLDKVARELRAGVQSLVPQCLAHGRAQSRRSCGSGQPSPGAEVAGVSPVPAGPCCRGLGRKRWAALVGEPAESRTFEQEVSGRRRFEGEGQWDEGRDGPSSGTALE